ncbi:hypothetical protein ACJZ2D_006516 [Fusarium nematophilum]
MSTGDAANSRPSPRALRLPIQGPLQPENRPARSPRRARWSPGPLLLNKTIPIYMLDSSEEATRQHHPHLLYITLHNYLYRRWFRPYRIDIEYGQFIAKMLPWLSTGPSAGVWMTFDWLSRELAAEDPDARVAAIVRHQIAVGIVKEDLKRVEFFRVHPVETARTTVETAVSFVMALEEREEAAFGPWPDPVASTANDGPETSFYWPFQEVARHHGWRDDLLTGRAPGGWTPKGTRIGLEVGLFWTRG